MIVGGVYFWQKTASSETLLWVSYVNLDDCDSTRTRVDLALITLSSR